MHGATPMEAWCDIDPFARAPKAVQWFEAWDGLLTGYRMRRWSYRSGSACNAMNLSNGRVG
jgi:hypothetical protein